jgi:hypothetical protein
MNQRKRAPAGDDTDSRVAVDVRVRVYPDTDAEARGVVVEDFGELPRQAVKIGNSHIADAARRWAVVLDTGGLVFVDTEHLVAE